MNNLWEQLLILYHCKKLQWYDFFATRVTPPPKTRDTLCHLIHIHLSHGWISTYPSRTQLFDHYSIIALLSYPSHPSHNIMEHKHHAAISVALLLSIVLISCTYLSVNDSPHINEQIHDQSTNHQRQLTIVDPKMLSSRILDNIYLNQNFMLNPVMVVSFHKIKHRSQYLA